MDKLIKAQLEVSEKRTEMAALIDAEAPEPEKITAAKAAVTEAEKRLQVALTEEVATKEVEKKTQPVDAEGREIRQLLIKASLGRMLGGILEETEGEGADRELRQALHLPNDYIPLALLETRDAVITTGDEPANPQPFINRLFPQSAAAFCGVDVQSVDVGQQLVPVLSTGVTIGGPHTDSTESVETTGAVALSTLQPRRFNGSFAVKQSDLATFPMLEESLREDLSGALQSAIDADLLNRTDAGLLEIGTDPAVPSIASVGGDFLRDAFSGVDGLFAANINQVRVLFGPTIYAYAGALANDSPLASLALEKLQQLVGGVFVSNHVPAYAGNFQEALVVKGPARRNCVGALWSGVQIIRDEVTRARFGEVRLHVIGMFDFAVVRPAGYIRQRYRTA